MVIVMTTKKELKRDLLKIADLMDKHCIDIRICIGEPSAWIRSLEDAVKCHYGISSIDIEALSNSIQDLDRRNPYPHEQTDLFDKGWDYQGLDHWHYCNDDPFGFDINDEFTDYFMANKLGVI